MGIRMRLGDGAGGGPRASTATTACVEPPRPMGRASEGAIAPNGVAEPATIRVDARDRRQSTLQTSEVEPLEPAVAFEDLDSRGSRCRRTPAPAS